MIEIKGNQGFFDPDKEGVDIGHSKEGAIKGSLLWKSVENIEMINSKDRVLLTNLGIILLSIHSNLEHIYGCMKQRR